MTPAPSHDGHLWHDPKVVELPRPLRSGDKVRVYGKGAPATINLQLSAKMSDGIVLHMNPRRAQKCVVRNSYESAGGWREEELDGAYPFSETSDRWMYELVMNEGEVLMKVDGSHFNSFSFRDGRRAGNVAFLDVQAYHRCHVGRSREVVLTLNREIDVSLLETRVPKPASTASSPPKYPTPTSAPRYAGSPLANSGSPTAPSITTPSADPQQTGESTAPAAEDISDAATVDAPARASAASEAPAPAKGATPTAKKLKPRYPCPIPKQDERLKGDIGLAPAQRKFSLTKIPIPEEVPLLQTASLLRRLVKEDCVHWFHMSRDDLLERLVLLGITALEHREAVITAFRKHSYAFGFNPTPPDEPMPPPPPEPAEDPPPGPTKGDGTPTFENGPNSPSPTPRLGARATAVIDAPTRAEVERMLLVPSYGLTFERSLDKVKISSSFKQIHDCTAAFGECGGGSCGCYRLRWPWVRVSFRNFVVRRTVQQMARALRDGRSRAVRYVSIGCGSLLTDFEILCGLQMKGLTIEAISLVDAEYKRSGSGVTPNGTPYTGTGELKGGGPAIQALSDFFPGARVSAFDAISSLRHAVVEYPEVYGSATTVVRCDAAAVPSDEAKVLAARLLAPGGHYFVQSNNASTRKLKDGKLVNGKSADPNPSEEFNSARDCYVRDPIGGPSTVADPEGFAALHKVGWPADDFFVSKLRRVHLKGFEGDGPLVSAAELAPSIADAQLYRVEGDAPATIYEGDEARPFKDESNVLGTRQPGTHVLGQPPLKKDADGTWVRVHRHDPHRFSDGWFGAPSMEVQRNVQWVRLAGEGESVTELDPRANDGEILAQPCEPDDEAEATQAELDALQGLPAGGAPALEETSSIGDARAGGLMTNATYAALGAGIH